MSQPSHNRWNNCARPVCSAAAACRVLQRPCWHGISCRNALPRSWSPAPVSTGNAGCPSFCDVARIRGQATHEWHNGNMGGTRCWQLWRRRCQHAITLLYPERGCDARIAAAVIFALCKAKQPAGREAKGKGRRVKNVDTLVATLVQPARASRKIDCKRGRHAACVYKRGRESGDDVLERGTRAQFAFSVTRTGTPPCWQEAIEETDVKQRHTYTYRRQDGSGIKYSSGSSSGGWGGSSAVGGASRRRRRSSSSNNVSASRPLPRRGHAVRGAARVVGGAAAGTLLL